MTDIWGAITDSVSSNQRKTLAGAEASIKGTAATQVARFEAEQIMQNAKAIEAVGIRESTENKLRGDIMISNAKARMAAGGGSTQDAGAVEMTAKMEQNRDYNAAASVYQAKTQGQAARGRAVTRWIESDILEREGKFGSYQAINSV